LGITALILALLGLLLGLWPLWPHSSALSVVAAAMAVLPMLAALLLGLGARSRALRDQQPLRIATAAVGLAVAATMLCSLWLVALSLTLHPRTEKNQAANRQLPPSPPRFF
jgi:hypothetical protein